jgi:Tfp pilus assembly protein PilO
MNISEKNMDRIRVLVIALSAGILLASIWFAVLSPFNSERRRLETRIEEIKAQLLSKDFLRSPDTLQAELDRESQRNTALLKEWNSITRRIAGFAGLTKILTQDFGNIDYKIALIEGRDRLRTKALNMDIGLPKDIGMDMKVSSNEDARKLMLQLCAVEKLVDMALDLKIKTVRFVEPMEQCAHSTTVSREVFIEEYPVKIQLYGTMENLYAFFDAITRQNHFFVLKQLRIETASENKPDILNITAVMSALLFTKKPGDITMFTPDRTPARMAPQGH